MPSLIKYVLFLAADLVIIGCLIHFSYSTLYGSTALEEFTARANSSFRSRSDELKVYSYYTAVFLASGLALYGALIFLFSWMPHQWVSYSEDGDDPIWMAEGLAGTGAIGGTIALIQGLLHAHAKILELRNSQLREEKAKAFKKMIEGALYQIDSMLRYPELRDTLVRLEHEIDDAEKKFKIYAEDAAVCRRLLNTFRTARELAVNQ